MLLINGFDLIMVGRFELSAVAPYSAAALLVLFLESIQNAVFGVFIPHAAGMHAREESGALGELLLRSTRLGICLLLLGALPLIVFSHEIIGLWLGASYSNEGGGILTMLLIANVIRLIGTPYSTILIGTGLQRLIVVSPLLEGVTNLTASIVLGLQYGAIGVAWGTLIGAVIGIGCHIFYNMPRTQSSIRLPVTTYLSGVVRILGLAGMPFAAAYSVVAVAKHTPTGIWGGALACAMGICFFVLLSNYRNQAPSR
jgi:O-antigen/teichoic acid export membrane protein